MRIEKGDAHTATYWTVRVDPGELVVESGKKLPYGTWIGTITQNGTINVWTPAASVPRGYRDAAREMLEDAKRKLIASGDVKVGRHGRYGR